MNATKKMVEANWIVDTCEVQCKGEPEKNDRTMLIKNQCLLMVSWSKKKTAPVRASLRKFAARAEIQWNIEKPGFALRIKRAIACCRKRPTITVGLILHQCAFAEGDISFTKIFQPDYWR